MVSQIQDVFAQLQNIGLYDFILPFLLVFTIVFAILEKTYIFGKTSGPNGESKRNINAVVALVLGLIIVNQFEIIQSLNNFLPKISFFIIVSLMILILFGLFGANVERGLSGFLLTGAAIISLVATYWALGPSLDFRVPYWVQDNASTILVLLIILIIIFAVVSGGGNRQQNTFDTWHNNLEKLWGRGPSH
ncbi:hypothetical protein HYT57_02425 [Candidatus Woesearchaeota archaeon]|nr:hypothetical protein [Candidatus Woesearchaeota archaeon]